MWFPATWTSLEARDPGAPALLGQLPDFIRLRTLLDDLERLMDSSDGPGPRTVPACASGVGGARSEMAPGSGAGPGSVCAGVGAADGSAGDPEGEDR